MFDRLERPIFGRPRSAGQETRQVNTQISGTTTVGETGWARVDSQTMRWVSPEIAEGAGRHALQLKGYGRRLGISATWLPPEISPDDAQEVADELDDAWAAILPLPALIVLRSALDSVITAMEAAQ
jgi:hypothetical protein